MQKKKDIGNIWAHRVIDGNIEVLGIGFHYERNGILPCAWTKIRFLRNRKEVYRLELDRTSGSDTNDVRREYFNKRKFRQYNGNQFSFIEYCAALQTDPTNLENTDELAKMLGMDKKILEGYSKFVQDQLKI